MANHKQNTVDDAEIAHFSQISTDWWDENGPFRPLHALNPTRLRFIADEVAAHFHRKSPANAPLSSLRVLDCGCGGGLLSEPMARLGARVTGIDADENAIAVAKAHAKGQGLNIDYRHTTLEQLAEDGEEFDIILALEIIEHVRDVKSFVQNLSACLDDDGLLLLSTLNRSMKSYLLGIIAAERLLRWVPQGTHDWDKFLTPDEVRAHLSRHGLKQKTIRGISFGPVTRQWRLSNDTSVNYILSASF